MPLETIASPYVSGGILAGLATAFATGFTVWLRMTRIENAKARETVAASGASEAKHEGQHTEIKSLRDRIDEMDSHHAAQTKIMTDMRHDLALVQASIVGLSMHFANMLLCEDCQKKNKLVIKAIQRILEEVMPEKSDSSDAPTTKEP